MRNEAEFGNSNGDGSKVKGSDKADTAVEKHSSGNGLVHEFSKITEPKTLSPAGEAEKTAALPESGSSMRTDAGIVGSGQPVASAMESTNKALAREAKPNGSTRQASAGEFGKIKSTGVGDAFPPSAELLQGLKI